MQPSWAQGWMGGAPTWGTRPAYWTRPAESCPLVAGGAFCLAGLCMWVDSGEGQQEGVREQTLPSLFP